MDKKEVRDILLRRIVRLDGEFWGAAPADAKFHFHGVRDGAGDVRLFGVTHLTRRYQAAEMGAAEAFEVAEKALISMGRPMRIASAPEEKACFFAPGWIAPVLLTVRQEETGLQLSAYTGRSLLLGKPRCHVALWLLRRRLPGGTVAVKGTQKEAAGKPEKKKKTSPEAKKTPKQGKKKKYTPKRLKK